MQSRKQCSVKGSCSAVTKLYRSTHQTQSITSSRVSRARWHTRTQRKARIQRPNALEHRLCTVPTTERGVEKDSQQRTANNRGASTSSHTVMSETLRPSRRDLPHQTCRATRHSVQKNKNTSVAWPYRSPHQTPSIASLTGWAGQLATSTTALP